MLCMKQSLHIIPGILFSILFYSFQLLQQTLRIMQFLLEFLFTPLSTSGLVFLFSLAAVALVHLNTRPKPLQPPTDINQQTVGVAVSAIICHLNFNMHF